MKRHLTIIMAVAMLAIFLIASSTYAIGLPSSTPAIINKYVYQHVLEPDDMLVIIYENAPYATIPPDYDYSEAFIWRFIDTDGTTELAQAVGYDYNDSGYGYTVIGFYFPPDDAPDWGLTYYLNLSGTPSAFASPPEYTYQITASDYSALTDTDDVKTDIAARILLMAADLNNKWGLTVDYSLLSETETGSVLSIYGEAFFRGALYGLQAYAPDAFRLIINNISSEALADRTWNPEYSENLTTQHAGTDIDTGMAAGNDFLGVSYNLFGMLITLVVLGGLAMAGLYVGGDWWGSLGNCVTPAVILTRMGVFGMGELALVAAVGWLFFSAKTWKVI